MGDISWIANPANAGKIEPGYSSTDVNLSPEDAALYSKLRQHPWNSGLAWTGNRGGHYGSYEPGFLQAFVLPLLDDRRNLLHVGGNF